MKMEILLNTIDKSFGNHQIFNKLTLHIQQNNSLAILGDSGKGKSTLLNIIALFEDIDSGDIFIDDINTKDIRFNKTKYWRYKVGYLFQNYALIDNLNVDRNLDIALKYMNENKKQKEFLKQQALDKVGLIEKNKNKVYTLSGGEQQRLAIARLLLKPCEIILADEPTGALDNTNTKYILELLNSFKALNKTLVIVTHDKEIAGICDEVLEL
jgi:putative ABC transport system ATP-binding protein